MPLGDALKNLKNAVTDLSSLHIQTYSGTLNFQVSDANYETIKTAVKQAAEGDNAAITLVAETLLQFDGDSYNFIATGADTNILQAHKDAVEAGLKTRQGLVDAFKDIILGS